MLLRQQTLTMQSHWTYHNPRESRHFPRGAQESERYPGLFSLFLFFSSFLIQDLIAKGLAPWKRREQTRVSHGVKQREAAPQSVEDSNVDSNGLWAQLALALVGGACLDT